tara:strand:+ start:87 stop:299 length:213 start_codon:yes stop_codon:yes gene_type:complete
MSVLTSGSQDYHKKQGILMSIEEQKEELDSVTRTAMKWKQEIDKLNAETDKKIEEFNKMTKKSKEWRKRE